MITHVLEQVYVHSRARDDAYFRGKMGTLCTGLSCKKVKAIVNKPKTRTCYMCIGQVSMDQLNKASGGKPVTWDKLENLINTVIVLDL